VGFCRHARELERLVVSQLVRRDKMYRIYKRINPKLRSLRTVGATMASPKRFTEIVVLKFNASKNECPPKISLFLYIRKRIVRRRMYQQLEDGDVGTMQSRLIRYSM
jgi:hypothetical protein